MSLVDRPHTPSKRYLALVACLLAALVWAPSGPPAAAEPAQPQAPCQMSFYGHVYRTNSVNGIAGAVVRLYKANLSGGWDLVATQTTGADGRFDLCCIPSDSDGGDIVEWKVEETDPPGYTSTGAEMDDCDDYPCMGWVSQDHNSAGATSKYCQIATAIRFYDEPPWMTRTPTATPTAAPWRSKTLQQGVSGYTGCRDAGISAWYPDENSDGPGHDTMKVRGGDQMAGLVKFGLTDSSFTGFLRAGDGIPTNATIVNATLEVYAWSKSGERQLEVGAYRVYRDWWASQVTWKVARTGVPWSVGGCNGIGSGADRDRDPVTTVVMSDTLRWYGFDLTSLVQTWVSTPSTNRGVVLKSVSPTEEFELITSDHGDVALRPKLVVRYTLPGDEPTVTTTRANTPTRTPSRTPTRTVVPPATATLPPYPWLPTATGTARPRAWLPLILRDRR